MGSVRSPTDEDKLSELAREAATRAYAPYSNFRVGAAVRGRYGLYTAGNVENGSTSLGLCAERAALAKALSEGDTEVATLAVACIDGSTTNELSLMPCGACRQWMVELCPDAEIIVVGVGRLSVSDLLPKPFSLRARPKLS